MKLIEEQNRIYGNNEQGKEVAEITWQTRDKVLWVDHTFTDPSLRGQGVAGKLLDALVEKAKRDNELLMPVCPYVVRKFDDEPEKYGSLDYRKHRK